jgi:hypothetical protein
MKRSSALPVLLAAILLSTFSVATYRVAFFTPPVGVAAQTAATR